MSSIKTSVVHKNYHYFTTRKKELRGLSDLPKPTPCQCHDLDLGKPSPPSPTPFSTLFKIWAAWGCVLLKLSSPWACRTARPLDRVIFSTLSGTIFAISSPWVRTLLSVLAWPASLLDCTCFFQLFWPRQPLHSRLVGTGPLQPYAWFQILAAPPLHLLPWGVMKHLYASDSSAIKRWWKTDLPHKEATRATK